MVDQAKISALMQVKAQATLLFSPTVIATAMDTLAAALQRDYADKDPVFVVVMNGGLVFAGQLLPRLDFPLEVDYCHATRYRGETRGGELVWKVTPAATLAGRHVVIVDDILDEGHTLEALLGLFEELGVASVKTLVLVEKQHNRKAVAGMRPDYCALQAPDKYLFGFGMDYQHYWRNADGIYCLDADE